MSSPADRPASAPGTGPAAAPGAALAITGLTTGYGSQVALERIEIEVPAGASVAVLGPNGSGKSSLFAAIVGLLEPWEGAVSVGPGGVAWLPQHLNSDPGFPVTVADVVRMGRWGRGSWLRRLDDADRRAVAEALGALGIAQLADRPFAELSGGQRQRALLAQAVARDSRLLLLDEPLTGVDRPTAEAIRDLVRGWRDQGRTVMVATHDLESAARDHDLVLALNRRVVSFGPPQLVCTEEVLRETFSGHVARLGEELVDTSHRHPGAA